ncbi:MAG: diaminopimelate decarboxylase [Planctomycetes bacterium]|nr:diaminopimelate decarboxylase [Planctomycetota bacterium]MCC7170329.1 diaminopimelate decarboxylase [Planctomycetota bacterium]
MAGFAWHDGRMTCDGIDVAETVARTGTPVYVYSANRLRENFATVRDAFRVQLPAPAPLIAFSVKSNSNLAVLDVLRGCGAGFDLVSGGELHRIRAIGADPTRAVFAGVGKSDDEIADALDAHIGWFDVESIAELETIDAIARAKSTRARVLLRVNPDVDAKTHRHITTGKRENKFGMRVADVEAVLAGLSSLPGIAFDGFHVHIGSQLTDVAPFCETLERLEALIARTRAAGIAVNTLNLGGGMGVTYRPDQPAPTPSQFALAMAPALSRSNVKLVLEPGRVIAADAGVLITRVRYVKRGEQRRFVVVDAAMTDLIRPALYEGFHPIAPVIDPERDGTTSPCDVVGPVCESADFLAQDRPLPPVARGDLLAVQLAGAYGFTMASNYNSRPRAAEILIEPWGSRVVRRRETYDDLVRGEEVPPIELCGTPLTTSSRRLADEP